MEGRSLGAMKATRLCSAPENTLIYVNLHHDYENVQSAHTSGKTDEPWQRVESTPPAVGRRSISVWEAQEAESGVTLPLLCNVTPAPRYLGDASYQSL